MKYKHGFKEFKQCCREAGPLGPFMWAMDWLVDCLASLPHNNK